MVGIVAAAHGVEVELLHEANVTHHAVLESTNDLIRFFAAILSRHHCNYSS